MAKDHKKVNAAVALTYEDIVNLGGPGKDPTVAAALAAVGTTQGQIGADEARLVEAQQRAATATEARTRRRARREIEELQDKIADARAAADDAARALTAARVALLDRVRPVLVTERERVLGELVALLGQVDALGRELSAIEGLAGMFSVPIGGVTSRTALSGELSGIVSHSVRQLSDICRWHAKPAAA